MNKHKSILDGNVERAIVSMTGSIAVGFISLFFFNIVDTFFIAQLGQKQLAAISFIFPITFLWMSILFGLNTGITSQIGKSLGKNKLHAAKLLTLNSIIFVFTVSVIISLFGYCTIDVMFSFMAADASVMIYIKEYLILWYCGFPLVEVAVTCGATLRGQGDAQTPARIALISSLVNGILDPILIFGLGPIPRLEITGAVLATISAWLLGLTLNLYYITHKTKLLNLRLFNIKFHHANLKNHFIFNVRSILKIGVPSVFTNAINPIAQSILIKIVALDGIAAVAGFGIGLRLEALATIFSISLSIAIVPFVSINFGAKNHARIAQGFRYAIKFIVVMQLLIYLTLFVLANTIASWFSSDPKILDVIVLYLRIIPGIYCFIGIIMIVLSTLNAMEYAKYSTLINLVRFFVLTIPLAYLGHYLFGIIGVFIGIVIAKLISFIIALYIYKKVNKNMMLELTSNI